MLDTIDSRQYRGFTSLLGGEIRRDLGRDWDIGAQASQLNSWNSSVSQTSAGASLGFSPMANMWIVAGYNFIGFDDADFSGADTRTQGPFISVRFKVDQDTLGLNNPEGGLSVREQP